MTEKYDCEILQAMIKVKTNKTPGLEKISLRDLKEVKYENSQTSHHYIQ